MAKYKSLFFVIVIVLAVIIGFYTGKSVSDISEAHGTEYNEVEDQKNNLAVDEINNLNREIPPKVIEVLAYVRQNNLPPVGYVGGEDFMNREKKLPQRDENNQRIKYKKWDVNPKIKGVNRGSERLITSPSKAYYTPDHYDTFIVIDEP